MDQLVDPNRRPALLERYVEEARADADQPRSRASRDGAPDSDNGSAAFRRSAVEPLPEPPEPPFLGARRVDDVPLAEVWCLLDRNTLFRHHWGGWKARGGLGELVEQEFEPTLAALQAEAEANRWLEPLIAYGYFPAAADGDDLVVFDPADPAREAFRLTFPRQPAAPRLCLADYFLPVDAPRRDVVAFQVVTVGPRPGEVAESLEKAGDYSKGFFLRGLASSAAEALAEIAHQRIRRELALPPDTGKRYSWGYPACPDLEQQSPVLTLLDAPGLIAVTLTPGFQLDPEHSTAAIVVHHPESSYFAVRP
jgi:5-methyltetrahydrofolate--homocysteine methyltransferase